MNDLTVTDVRVQPGDSAFLIDNGKTAILYDSGFAFTGYGVADNIRDLLGERGLDDIFLTHSHYDHALGSIYALKYWPDARVVAGEYAAKIFQKPTARAVMRDLDRKAADDCGVGDYFVVLNLPGHTKCSVGYYCPERRLLLSCETPGVFNGTDDVMPSYLVGYQMTLDSIARLEALEIESILVPHCGLLDREQTGFYLKRARENAVWTAEKLAAQLRAGRSKAEMIAWFKERFYHGRIKLGYPPAAMELNTGIMIDLLRKEFRIGEGEQ